MPCPPSYEEQLDSKLGLEHRDLLDDLTQKRKEILQAKEIISLNLETALTHFESVDFQRLMEILKFEFQPIPTLGGNPYKEGELQQSQYAVDKLYKMIAEEEEYLCELSCYLIQIWDKLSLWSQSLEIKNQYNSILNTHTIHRRDDKNQVIRNLHFKIERAKSGLYNYDISQLTKEIERINTLSEEVLLRNKNVLNGLGMKLD